MRTEILIKSKNKDDKDDIVHFAEDLFSYLDYIVDHRIIDIDPELQNMKEHLIDADYEYTFPIIGFSIIPEAEFLKRRYKITVEEVKLTEEESRDFEKIVNEYCEKENYHIKEKRSDYVYLLENDEGETKYYHVLYSNEWGFIDDEQNK